MMRCLLLDDELPGLMYLKILCEEIPNLRVVRAFNDPELFLKESAQLDFDFCILDIAMPKLNGLEIAGILKHKPIIFATAYNEFASEAYELEIIDYLRKPIKRDRLEVAIKKVADKLINQSSKEIFFTANTDQGKSIIYFKDLFYVSTSSIDPRDKEAFLANGTTIVVKNMSFEKLQQLLPSTIFIRVNKSQLLSKKIIKSFTSTELISSLSDPQGNPIRFNLSDSYRDQVLHALYL